MCAGMNELRFVRWCIPKVRLNFFGYGRRGQGPSTVTLGVTYVPPSSVRQLIILAYAECRRWKAGPVQCQPVNFQYDLGGLTVYTRSVAPAMSGSP